MQRKAGDTERATEKQQLCGPRLVSGCRWRYLHMELVGGLTQKPTPRALCFKFAIKNALSASYRSLRAVPRRVDQGEKHYSGCAGETTQT